MKPFIPLLTVLSAAALGVCGCESREGDAVPGARADAAGNDRARTQTAAAADAAGIAWFDGTVDAAFERARADGKPVFLFWSAVWCPYCADLKAHVFSRPDFREKLELFVPVYLDGDDAGAQKWADEFRVAGYPTVLALGPDREELARIAGGMDVSVYVEMLDLVLGDVRPLHDVLAALDDASELSPDDCRRLAYNGWALEDTPPETAAATAAVLADAAAKCPARATLERARLAAIAASYAVTAEGEAVGAEGVASPLLARLVADVRAVVADPALAASIADALQYLEDDFFAVANTLEPEQSARLLADWTAAMNAASDDTRYGDGDRLAAVRSKVVAVEGLNGSGEVPADLVAEAHELIDETLSGVAGSPARPGVVNSAVNLLVALDDPERAHGIAEQEMQRSKTPYYYMSDLAALDEMMGRTDAALGWLERGYRESAGAATRFQWGTSWVRGLIRMSPDDDAAVRSAAITVLGELEGPDRIYRRTRGRLETLDASLREWNAGGAHAEAVAAIRARMAEICAAVPQGEAEALRSCGAFLRK